MTGILYLAPSTLSGFNACLFATGECIKFCLNKAGLGIFSNVQKARIEKTKQFFENPAAFCAVLEKNIQALIRKAGREGFKPCVRLNGTSDIAWENTGLIQKFPAIPFYDYTKNPHRMREFLAGKMPANYHLTFSFSGHNEKDALEFLAAGGNVALVFAVKKGMPLPDSYMGYPVINGDETDVRFLDGKGVIVGLHAKGPARGVENAFIRAPKPVNTAAPLAA